MNKEVRMKNVEISETKEENVLDAEIWYPKVKGNPINTIQIGLMDVRAADSVRIKYDYDRDGWVITQSRYYHPPLGDNSYGYEEEWIEAAFIPAWQFELPEAERFTYKPGEKKEDDLFENGTYQIQYKFTNGENK